MKLSKSVAELQREHVVLELECIDRMYLNAYVPQLTSERALQALCAGIWAIALPPPNKSQR
jgi:hypothetical protein